MSLAKPAALSWVCTRTKMAWEMGPTLYQHRVTFGVVVVVSVAALTPRMADTRAVVNCEQTPFAAPAAADEGSPRLATLRARPPTHDITALALLLISTLHD